MPLARIIEALSNRRAYPHGPKTVRVVQTHISVVFIADDLVFKIKKPVSFGFLDFSELEKRKYYCEEEVRLNKRLCPDIYLGVVPVTDDGTGAVVEGTGPVVEYAVKMKRLPEDSMMDSLLSRGQVSAGDVRPDRRRPRPILSRRAGRTADRPVRGYAGQRAQLRRELQPDTALHRENDITRTLRRCQGVYGAYLQDEGRSLRRAGTGRVHTGGARRPPFPKHLRYTKGRLYL
jgi:hypothetical protein